MADLRPRDGVPGAHVSKTPAWPSPLTRPSPPPPLPLPQALFDECLLTDAELDVYRQHSAPAASLSSAHSLEASRSSPRRQHWADGGAAA